MTRVPVLARPCGPACRSPTSAPSRRTALCRVGRAQGRAGRRRDNGPEVTARRVRGGKRPHVEPKFVRSSILVAGAKFPNFMMLGFRRRFLSGSPTFSGHRCQIAEPYHCGARKIARTRSKRRYMRLIS